MSNELLQTVETPVSENPEVQAVEVTETPEDGQVSEQDVHDEGDKKEPWFKRRIDELSREKHEYRRQAEQMQRMLEQQQALMQQLQPPKHEPQALQPPKPEDYPGGQYDPRYIDARIEYAEAAAAERAYQRLQAETQQREQSRQQSELQARIQTAEAAARGKYADYDEAINGLAADPQLATNPVIRQALFGTDNGAEIGYLLGKNLDVAYEIASTNNPIVAGMKLAELMNRAPRKTVNAPPAPIKPLSGTAGSPVGKPLDQMSTEEYIRHMNALDLQRRQARFARS